LTLAREHWAQLAAKRSGNRSTEALFWLQEISDPTDLEEVKEVYLPLSQLIQLYVERTGAVFRDTHMYLGMPGRRTPFIIGIGGSVAVGKSTVARLIRELLAAAPGHPKVDLVTTDGFLYPNATLEERGLMARKGFPESYDRRALLQFVMDVKSGAREVVAPMYSHLRYDIVPDRQIVVRQPDILILEGLNVLQPAHTSPEISPALAISDFFDFSIYVDADEAAIKKWYIERHLRLRQTAFRDPDSYFARFADFTEEQSIAVAANLWDTINGPNLNQNIRPTRGRATVVLRKNEPHHVTWVRIRKI
jgi:type I pantothenate kinase